MKILCFMSDNRLLENDYNSLCAVINFEYCKKQNYDFIYYRPYLNENIIEINNCLSPSKKIRHASWSKILSSIKAHELNYDYCCYIDSDCIFKDFSIRLEDYFKLPNNSDIIFINSTPYHSKNPCAGFYLFKINENTKDFFKSWYNTENSYNLSHAWEQTVLWDMYDKSIKSLKVEVIDGQNWFSESKNQFLRHVAAPYQNNRKPYFSLFISDNKIDFQQNIKDIKIISFNTKDVSEFYF